MPKPDLKQILETHKLDLENLLVELEDLRVRCRDGIMQEKVSAKDGVLQVIERYPAIEFQINRLKFELLEEYSPKEEGATQLELILTDMTGQQLFAQKKDP